MPVARPSNSPAILLLLLLYGSSGATSVAYEVLWVRMLSLQFGVSVFAVVVTVAAFMAGLGAGSLLAARQVTKVRKPLIVLALLEGGIALYALLLPWLLKMTAGWMQAEAAQLSLYGWYGLQAVVCLLLLAIPAMAMGAGFPMILAASGRRQELLGRIYGMNTLGAAIGALLPLWLLPWIGWSAGIRLVATIGMGISMAFLLLAGREKLPEQHESSEKSQRPSWTSLSLYAGIGAAALILEIGWTRLFGMIMLRTEYVLAIILSAFLIGIGAGSLMVPRQHRQWWFAVLPIIACGFALFSLWMLPEISAWVERAEFQSLFTALVAQGAVLMVLTLPVTLALGAWLPLLHKRYDGAGMWLYGANSAGAAVGAIAAGIWLIPQFGSAATIVIAGFMLLVLGFSWVRQRIVWLAVPVLAAAAVPVWSLPPVSKLLPQDQAGSKNLYLYEDAVAITHVVERPDGQRLLLTDLQRMDASTEPTAAFVQSNQARLPLLLQGQPKSVLFLGLGTAISVSGSLPFPDLHRSAVELSKGAIVAADRWFSPVNRGVMKQTNVHRDDARHFLSATDKKYDVIIGDVFHPDLAGMSSLLSIEEFRRARAHLTDDGLFVQWLAINQFDIQSLGVILRTFRHVFPNAQLFLDGMHLAMVGPRQQHADAEAVRKNLARMNPSERKEATAGEGNWTWLGRYWGPIPQGDGPLQNEWSPVIEFRLPRMRYNGGLDVAATLQLLLNWRPDLQQAAMQLGVDSADKENFERAYAGTELMVRSWLAAMHGNAQKANRLMRLAYEANPKDRWIDYALADSMFASLSEARTHGLSEEQALRRILSINPEHVDALRRLWKLQRRKGEQAAAQESLARLLTLSPLDREARTAEN